MPFQDPLFRHNFLPLISLPSQWKLSAHGADEMLWLKSEPSDQAVYSLSLGLEDVMVLLMKSLEDVMVLPVKALEKQEVKYEH